MFDVAPGKEEEFHYLERSLALSDWLDRLIEATEPPDQSEPVRIIVQMLPPGNIIANIQWIMTLGLIKCYMAE